MAVAQPYPGHAGSAAPGTASNSLTYPPSIVGNRRRIDNRFPTLAFTINTGGQPYFEVLLATDPTLFDPANASLRGSTSFYSSRTHHGLSEAAEAAHPYLVPSAVLRAFVTATPRPSAIYYTLIAYASQDGGNPTFAHAPTALPSSAPAVAIAPDFTGNTLATVLAVSVHNLRRVGSTAWSATASAPPRINAEEDRGEGEDGFGAPQPAAVTAAPRLPALQAHAQPAPAPVQYAPASLADERYDLAVLPATNGHHNGHSVVLDPLLPGHKRPRVYGNGNGDMSAGLGMDYPAEQTDTPEYLQDDEDTQPYRDEAEALQFIPAGQYLSLDDGEAATPTAPRLLSVEDKIRIIERVAPFESGGDYGAINADGEFEGRFGSNHPAYQRYHVGLSYGLIQFTQDSGMLGQLLGMMRDRDGQEFARIFGADSDGLVRVANLEGPPSSAVQGGRSVRVQPVGGSDLWLEPWLSRFRAAGQVERFKAAQRELAARGYLEPMLHFARGFGLD